eukprot:11211619-Alexandrium_andersonii.AAC.1
MCVAHCSSTSPCGTSSKHRSRLILIRACLTSDWGKMQFACRSRRLRHMPLDFRILAVSRGVSKTAG